MKRDPDNLRASGVVVPTWCSVLGIPGDAYELVRKYRVSGILVRDEYVQTLKDVIMLSYGMSYTVDDDHSDAYAMEVDGTDETHTVHNPFISLDISEGISSNVTPSGAVVLLGHPGIGKQNSVEPECVFPLLV